MESSRTRLKLHEAYSRETVDSTSVNLPATIADLPTEMVLCVSDILSPVDLICFSLCNRQFRIIISGPVRRLCHTEDTKLQVLIRLERDLPSYFACEICRVLHQFDGSESFGLNALRKDQTCQLPCVRSGAWYTPPYTLNTHYGFDHSLARLSFLQVKLAMRRLYHGLASGISTEPLYYTQLRDYRSKCKGQILDMLSLFSIEAVICPDPLGFFVRLQDILIVEDWPQLFPHNGDRPSAVHSLKICYHLELSDDFHACIEEFAQEHPTDLVLNYEGRCFTCNMDFHIRASEPNCRPRVIITRWLDLGLGITTNDPLWQRQAFPELMVDRDYSTRETVSPRFCFELMSHRSHHELIGLNLDCITDKRQMRVSRWYERNRFKEYGFTRDLTTRYFFHKEPPRTRGFLEGLCSLLGGFAGQVHELELENIAFEYRTRSIHEYPITPVDQDEAAVALCRSVCTWLPLL